MKNMRCGLCLLAFSLCGFNCKAQDNQILYPISFEGKTGYIDRQYAMVIEPQFEEGHFFSEGYARVKVNGKWGLINPEGKVVKLFDFVLKGDLHDGYMRFLKGGKIGFIDKNGKILIDGFEDARDFSEGIAAIKSDMWTYLKKNGDLLKGKEFYNAFSFNEGVAIVVSDRVGVIEKNGNYVLSPEYSGMSKKFSEGLCYAAAARNPNDTNSGFIDFKGDIIIPKLFNAYTSFYKGNALVAVGHVPRPLFWSLIDNTGKVLIERVDITMAEDFYEGIAVVDKDVGKKTKEGYMDYTGKMLVEPQFDQAQPFTQGVGIGYNNDEQVAFVDREGKITWVKDIIARWKNSR